MPKRTKASNVVTYRLDTEDIGKLTQPKTWQNKDYPIFPVSQEEIRHKDLAQILQDRKQITVVELEVKDIDFGGIKEKRVKYIMGKPARKLQAKRTRKTWQVRVKAMADPENRQVTEWYQIATNYLTRRVPVRDREDLVQEIVLRCIERGATKTFLAYLIAKEILVKYWRRGKIGNRVYRNILLTKFYWRQQYRTVIEEGKRVKVRDKVLPITKYTEDPEEEVTVSIDAIPEENVSDEGIQESMLVDRLFLESLPARIREIITRRSEGYPLEVRDRVYLHRWLKKQEPVAM